MTSARVEGQRGAVLPSLPERRLDVMDRRAVDRDLDVVPRGCRTVGAGHLNRLLVAPVIAVVTTAVAQVDAPDVGDVPPVGSSAYRITTNFWWWAPLVRTRMSRRH